MFNRMRRLALGVVIERYMRWRTVLALLTVANVKRKTTGAFEGDRP